MRRVLKWLKNTVIYVLARALMALTRRLGFSRSLRFGRFLGRRAFGLAGGVRREALMNLALAFPEMKPEARTRLLRSSFEHFGKALVECVNIRRLANLESYVRLEPRSKQVLDDALRRGRGVVFVTGHVGNWELMARALAQLGYPIYTIGKKSYDERFTRLIRQFRKEGSVHTIWRGDSGVFNKMVDVLRQAWVMGLLIDQDTNVPGTFVPFFGQLAHTPTVAAVLARRTAAAVVTGFNHRLQDGGYQIVIENFKLSEISDFESAVQVDTAMLTARIEAHIRAHPSEWVWMHRRWKTRPQNRNPGTPHEDPD